MTLQTSKNEGEIMYHRILMGAAAGVLFIGSAAQADETLKWRTVQHLGSMQTLPVDNGHTLGLYRLPGIVFFQDGSTGTSIVFGTSDIANGSGPVSGYSTVTFNDGSELALTFTGQAGKGGAFIVLGGKGRFAGAKGDGTWDTNATTVVARPGANTDSINYLDAVINIKK
jgi:hypothetical protein